MSKARKILMPIVCGLFLFALDRMLKLLSLTNWNEPRLFGRRWFGWQPFLNPGIAFGIPLPAWFVVTVTIPIVAVITYFAVRAARQEKMWLFLAGVLVMAGALSNLLDRVMYGSTVDYFRILTGVINIADVCILLGGVVFAARITRRSK